jgi:hypothetical protein
MKADAPGATRQPGQKSTFEQTLCVYHEVVISRPKFSPETRNGFEKRY